MPWYRFELESPLPSAQVLDRVRSAVRPEPTLREWLTQPWPPQIPPLVGSVRADGFLLRWPQWRNPAPIRVRGRVQATSAGSRMQVLIHLHPLAAVLWLCWFGFAVMIAVEWMRLGESPLRPLGMAVAGLAYLGWRFHRQIAVVRPLLAEALQQEPSRVLATARLR